MRTGAMGVAAGGRGGGRQRKTRGDAGGLEDVADELEEAWKTCRVP
jgi:hypothetical protein